MSSNIFQVPNHFCVENEWNSLTVTVGRAIVMNIVQLNVYYIKEGVQDVNRNGFCSGEYETPIAGNGAAYAGSYVFKYDV